MGPPAKEQRWGEPRVLGLGAPAQQPPASQSQPLCGKCQVLSDLSSNKCLVSDVREARDSPGPGGGTDVPQLGLAEGRVRAASLEAPTLSAQEHQPHSQPRPGITRERGLVERWRNGHEAHYGGDSRPAPPLPRGHPYKAVLSTGGPCAPTWPGGCRERGRLGPRPGGAPLWRQRAATQE